MDEPKKELNANEKLILQKAKQRQREQREQKIKDFFILLFVLAVFVGGGCYYFSRFMRKSYDNLQYITTVNQTTLQISQLIDNIRNAYALHPDEPAENMDRLIDMGAIPEKLIRGHGKERFLVNPFGGRIVIRPSVPLTNAKGDIVSPTFKMAYQGLPREACIDLAMLDWGDSLKGLLAVAIGGVDFMTGIDNTLEDIDRQPEKKEPVAVKGKNGRKRMVRPRMQYMLNVAKPGDQFMPTPFSKGNAEAGCFCGRNECSFALRYAVFGYDEKEPKPR